MNRFVEVQRGLQRGETRRFIAKTEREGSKSLFGPTIYSKQMHLAKKKVYNQVFKEAQERVFKVLDSMCQYIFRLF